MSSTGAETSANMRKESVWLGQSRLSALRRSAASGRGEMVVALCCCARSGRGLEVWGCPAAPGCCPGCPAGGRRCRVIVVGAYGNGDAAPLRCWADDGLRRGGAGGGATGTPHSTESRTAGEVLVAAALKAPSIVDFQMSDGRPEP